MALTPKQQLFVQEYLVDLNATQAAIRAGYSAASARNQGYRMMTNDDISGAIRKAMEERCERTEAGLNRFTEELSLIAYANIHDYLCLREGKPTVNLHTLTREQAAAIREIEVGNYIGGGTRLRMNDKLAALIALGRHLEKAMARDERRLAALAEQMKAEAKEEEPPARQAAPAPAEGPAPGAAASSDARDSVEAEPSEAAGCAGDVDSAEATRNEPDTAAAERPDEAARSEADGVAAEELSPAPPARPAKISADEAERRFLAALQARSAGQSAETSILSNPSAGPDRRAFDPAAEPLGERGSGASATAMAARTG